jgi:hypothetical protein
MLDCDVACSKVASWHFVGTRDLMVRRLYSINQTTHRVIVVVSVCYVYFVAATRFASNSLLLLSGQGNIGGVVWLYDCNTNVCRPYMPSITAA